MGKEFRHENWKQRGSDMSKAIWKWNFWKLFHSGTIFVKGQKLCVFMSYFQNVRSVWGEMYSGWKVPILLLTPASVQLSHSVISDCLWPHELQHARPPCPSPTPRVHPNPCPLSWWCHPAISSFVISFSCPQSFPASGSFQWVSSSHQVAKVLEFQLQHQSFQWTSRTELF